MKGKKYERGMGFGDLHGDPRELWDPHGFFRFPTRYRDRPLLRERRGFNVVQRGWKSRSVERNNGAF